MKKLFYILLFLLPGVVFAQSYRPTLFSMKNDMSRSKPGENRASELFSQINSGRAGNLQIPDQGSVIQILDSVYLWQLDTLNNAWKIYDRSIKIGYDVHYNRISSLSETWNGSMWVNLEKDSLIYDINNNLTDYIEVTWNGSAWGNAEQNIYTYDANNNQTSVLMESWNGSNWMHVYQQIYTYNATNKETNEVDQIWNDSIWVNQEQTIFGYNAIDSLTSKLVQSWNNNAWVSTWQYLYSYNSNNKRTNELDQSLTGSTWVNVMKDTLTYDDNNLISEFYQQWFNDAWVNASNITFTYDTHNNRTSESAKRWFSNAWVNSEEDILTYDVNNFLKSFVFNYWNTAGTFLTSGDSCYYYFHTVLGINNLLSQDRSIVIYPNPAKNKCEVQCAKCKIKSIEIFNLAGEKVYDTGFSSGTDDSIEVSFDLPAGIYFVKVMDEKNMIVKKMIVE